MCVSVVFILAQLNCSDWFACSKLQLELRRFCPHPEQKHLFVQPKNLWPCLIVTSRSWCFFCLFLSAVLCLQMLLPLYWLNGDSPVLSHSCFLSSKTKFTESDPAAPEYRKKHKKLKIICVWDHSEREEGGEWEWVNICQPWWSEKRIPEIMGWFLPGVPIFFLFVFVCLFFKYSSKAGKGG